MDDVVGGWGGVVFVCVYVCGWGVCVVYGVCWFV